MMKKVALNSIFFLCILSAFGQSEERKNIVPNNGFEEYSGIPLGWFYSGRDFSIVMKYWASPSAASPDIYGPKIHVPKQWKQKGFGALNAHQGSSFVGLTTFGCDQGKPHCREYIQIQLLEPLIPNQKYRVSIAANHLTGSVQMKELQIFFGANINEYTSDTILLQEANCVLKLPKFLNAGWQKITTEFKAPNAAEYMTIGNFEPDRNTALFDQISGIFLPYAYYYLDDVEVYKVPPILKVPEDENSLIKKDISTGKIIRLHNLYFDLDKADFLPRSYDELNTLCEILKERPSLQIDIIGHTDDTGTEKYNNELSLSRAKAVVEYLVSHGIDFNRLSYKGKGHSEPIASNDTMEGRQLNRRVEFLVVKE